MKPERWQQIKQVLDGALALPNGERSSYLEGTCASDDELRHEVESLLLHHAEAGTKFLGTPVMDLKGQASASNGKSGSVAGRIGAYDIVEQIGHGGMGEVYRATRADGQYTKQVAIKIVRSGFDVAFLLERFRHERQILASLDHPNIARLLDGGTTEQGIPYLVMELVEGVPIDQYCDRRTLPISERLRLFRQVCAAVQYAHQHLVIHRDIKPSNILVTEEGVPKLLDFGIAKILDPSTVTETTLLRPMTPEYASPEQIRSEPVTTATDVYSLGVVLYRLLTGCSPYSGDTRTSHQLAHAICDLEPNRPSTVIFDPSEVRGEDEATQLTSELVSRAREGSPAKLSRRLRGDLDNIALKALRKEPDRRFASVEQFAEDVRRHLEGLPVTARKDSWSYRASKFVRRHRIAVAATAFAVVVSIAGVVLILREARIAQANGRRAEQRFKEVRKLANSLMFEIHDSIKDLPGSTPARKLLVSRALEYLDSLSMEAKGDPSLQRELAAAYQRIGDVQGQPRQANLGDPAGAAASYRKAIRIQETLLASDPGNIDLLREMVPNYGKLSDVLRDMAEPTAAMENSRKEMEAAQAVYKANPTDPANRLLFATYRMDYGYKQATVARERDAGLENLKQGSALLEQIVSEDPQNLHARRILGLSYSRLADILRTRVDDRAQALGLYRKALAVKKELLADDPNNTDFRRLVAYDQFNIAHLLADLHDGTGALSLGREALSSFQQLAAADPTNAMFPQDIAEVRGDIGETLMKMGNLPSALEQVNLSLASAERMSGAEDFNLPAGFIVASDQYRIGEIHALLAFSPGASARHRIEQCHEAELWFQKCLPAFESLRKQPSPRFDAASGVTEIRRELTRCSQETRTVP